MRKRLYPGIRIGLIFLSLLLPLAGSGIAVAANSLSATAVVEKTELFVGEPLIFQIQINGSDNPSEPDLTGIQYFSVEERGGQNISSSSIVVINGRMRQAVKRAYVFSYKMTPEKAGKLIIPSIEVLAEGQTLRTRPVRLKVSKPIETDDFKLRMNLSATKAYVGQPLILTTIWYIGKNVKDFQFVIPVLSDTRFESGDMDLDVEPGQKDQYIRFPMGKREIVAKKDRGVLDGKEYLTISFQKFLIPKQAGNLSISPTTVSFKVATAFNKRRQFNSSPEEFFSNGFFFSGGQPARYKSLVVPSNTPILSVLNLPKQEQPSDFTGLVGQYQMEASAVPVQVRIGDPITLTLRIKSTGYARNITLPPLDQQKSLHSDFKIPHEMAPGKVEKGMITYTQTLRAKHSSVNAIPPIELPYFDVKQGRYTVAKTAPIPLVVRTAKIVTAKDAEGVDAATEIETELETLQVGIAYNYVDLSVLTNQAKGLTVLIDSPMWMALFGGPPIFFFIIFSFQYFVQRQKNNSDGKQARRAYGEFKKTLRNIDKTVLDDPNNIYPLVLEAFRKYLGSKLKMASGSFTYDDVGNHLADKNINKFNLKSLKEFFDAGEAGQFAGNTLNLKDSASFIDQAKSLAKNLDRSLR